MAGEYISKDRVNGYLCRPREARGAGMLLLPHVTGIRQEIRDETQAFADAGYVAFAWDPYPGFNVEATDQQPPRCVDDNAAADQSRCIDYMLEHLGVQRLGVLGWCMGGRMALTLAARDARLAACVAYYPSIRNPRHPEEVDAISEASKIGCPVEVVYPGKDHVTSNDSFRALRAELEKRTQPTLVQLYPEAVHGFLSRQEVEENRRAGQLCWPQTMALLRAALLP